MAESMDNLTTGASTTSFVDKIFGIVQDIYSSPINIALLAASCYLLYKIYQDKYGRDEVPRRPPPLPKLPRRDFTLEELRAYDGTENAPESRILIACNGKVFDVTRGRGFYGPGGPYGIFAGRDASRGLATHLLNDTVVKDVYDDLSDLSSDQINTMEEWAAKFSEKYDEVGRLLRPGEVPTDYSIQDDAGGTPNNRPNTDTASE